MTSQTPAVATQGVTPVSAAVMEQVVINGDWTSFRRRTASRSSSGCGD